MHSPMLIQNVIATKGQRKLNDPNRRLYLKIWERKAVSSWQNDPFFISFVKCSN